MPLFAHCDAAIILIELSYLIVPLAYCFFNARATTKGAQMLHARASDLTANELLSPSPAFVESMYRPPSWQSDVMTKHIEPRVTSLDFDL
jgi:hypothetical protein